MSEAYTLEKFGLMVYGRWKDIPRRGDERPTFKRLEIMIQQLQLLAYPYDNGIPYILCGPSKAPGAPAASTSATVRPTADHVTALITTIITTLKSLATRKECKYALTPLTEIVLAMNANLPLQEFRKAKVDSFSGDRREGESAGTGEDNDNNNEQDQGAPKTVNAEGDDLVIVCVSPPPNFVSVIAKSDNEGIEFSADVNKMKTVYLQNFFF